MQSESKKFYLGFDFGTRRIGVAVGQKLTQTATPLATINWPPNSKLPWDKIDTVLAKWQPNALIVGFPRNLDGSDDQMTPKAKTFMRQLKKRYKLPVIPVDERLTTKAARERIYEESGYKGFKDAEIDSMAAKIILESWLADPVVVNNE